MSPAVWTELRRAFFKQLPSKVTLTYLSSVLSISEKTAKNVLPQLRNVGLVDSEGVPTPLTHDFRFEESYPKACAAILETVYPVEVLEIFTTKDADPTAVANWFMRYSGSGQATAKVVAKFYLHLVGAERIGEDVKPRTPKTAKPKKVASVSTESNVTVPSTDAEPVSTEHQTLPQPNLPHKPAPQQGPSLHVDLQVHIDSSASTDQIDAIFASMAKHLYGR